MTSNTSQSSAMPVYATAIPVPISKDSHSFNLRSQLQREQSSYRLPSKENMPKDVDENAVKKLKQQGFTTGLAHSLSKNNKSFPLRIWVVDNSGSMQTSDGHRIIPSKSTDDVRFAQCTRWAELKDNVGYHTEMAALLQAPTIFRFLNDPGVDVGDQQFSIAENSTSPADIMRDVQNATSIMRRALPGGVTPLIPHILEIQQAIMEMSPDLINNGQRVTVVLATDGLPTDDYGVSGKLINDQFVESLRLLEGLPVWVVVRLCTDDDTVVDFYNDLDEQLELSIEVLDDFMGEAMEVYAKNPWLNYSLPLHRCREMGFYDRLFDLLDERKLTKGELRDFCILLFGDANMDGVVDPEEDWSSFYDSISKLVHLESDQWHPIKRKMSTCLNLNALNRIYGESSNSCVLM